MNRRALLGLFSGMGLLMLAGIAVADDKADGHDHHHFRAKEVIGAQVHIKGDEAKRTVDDIVLDEHGNVDYLIVMNGENKYASVPWDAVSFDAKARVATVNVTADQYHKVPVYSNTQYPTFTPAYRTKTYQYFGLTPGQERRMIRRGTR